jgi:hypothetical protein
MEPPPISHQPRILCLHGGGTNATILRRQARTLHRALSPYFRLVYADGPHACAPGPDVAAVYAAHAPFRRWLRWLRWHAPLGDAPAAAAIRACVRSAMAADDAAGGRGPWVGLLGFSQGGKVAASVLFDAQERRRRRKVGKYAMEEDREGSNEDSDEEKEEEEEEEEEGDAGWRFAVLLASRAPLVALGNATLKLGALQRPGDICTPPVPGERKQNTHRLWLPTVHVHGLRDPGLHFHRALADDFTAPGSAEVVEWEGDHRVPIKGRDVERVVQATLRVAKVRLVIVGAVFTEDC